MFKLENSWIRTLIIGIILGVGLTVLAYNSFLSPEIKYKLALQKEQLRSQELEQKSKDQEVETTYWKQKASDDSLVAAVALQNVKNVETKYVPLRTNIINQPLDSDIIQSRRSLPKEDPYQH